jgi:hypothetical protein
MREVQLLPTSKPGEPLKSRSLYVVFPIEKDVRVKGHRARNCLNNENFNRQHEVCARSDQKHWNEEEGRIVAFVPEVRPRDEMILGIVGVMTVDVIAIKDTAHWMVAEPVMHQRLPE